MIDQPGARQQQPESRRRVSLRQYSGRNDHPAMVGVRNSAMRRNGFPSDATVEGMDAKYDHLAQPDITRDITLAELSGEVVAYARTTLDELADGTRQAAVIVLADPDAVARAEAIDLILAHALQRSRELLAGLAHDLGQILVSFPGFDQDCRRSAEAAGFREVRREATLSRSNLGQIPQYVTPNGIQVRSIDPTDRNSQREAFVAASALTADSWGALVRPDEELDGLAAQPSFNPALWRVAYDHERIVGVVLNSVEESNDEGAPVGWSEDISIAAEYRDGRLLRALIAESLRALRDAGAESAAAMADLLNPGLSEDDFEKLGYRVVGVNSEFMRPRTALGSTIGPMNDRNPQREKEPAAQPSEEQPIHERSDKGSDYNDPVDDASDDSFPASDPPSFTDTSATRRNQDR